MIAVVLLQFAGGNMGEHQLHLGNHDQETENHPHIQFMAQVVSLESSFEQCTACSDSNHNRPEASCTSSDDGELLVSNLASHVSGKSEPEHNHKVSKTETQLFDLCLDCQCHGGHVTVMTSPVTDPSLLVDEPVVAKVTAYLPPEALPDYRPPIV
ncbi:hypothetical protein [Shewanella violacea]|uniref:Uncharacterized protein n=1 Tax=Shewanella violacea (strain JCM 10179 / CIP 106290 / LMG 19151 / DSS12) TaxID=637905 RepID=D4ZCK2_SHEVD|nr:conserved hypothetical protein [Shewanella violacea DSS12]